MERITANLNDPEEIARAHHGSVSLEMRQQTETAAVVIRLAESASAWSHREVKPALGKWCEGYITIRGTWCERLDIAKVNRLNQRLAEVQRELRQAGTTP